MFGSQYIQKSKVGITDCIYVWVPMISLVNSVRIDFSQLWNQDIISTDFFRNEKQVISGIRLWVRQNTMFVY